MVLMPDTSDVMPALPYSSVRPGKQVKEAEAW